MTVCLELESKLVNFVYFVAKHNNWLHITVDRPLCRVKGGAIQIAAFCWLSVNDSIPHIASLVSILKPHTTLFGLYLVSSFQIAYVKEANSARKILNVLSGDDFFGYYERVFATPDLLVTTQPAGCWEIWSRDDLMCLFRAYDALAVQQGAAPVFNLP